MRSYPEDFFVFRPPVAKEDFELNSFAEEVAKALQGADSFEERPLDLDDGFRRVDSCVIKGQNTFLVFFQSNWMVQLIKRYFLHFILKPPTQACSHLQLMSFRYNNILLLDSTHRVSRVDLPLFLIAMRTNVRYVVGFPTPAPTGAC